MTKRLGSFAALFAVPTMIAGIYGINFKSIPELDWVYGYPTCLAVMLLVDVVLYWRFKKAGWLIGRDAPKEPSGEIRCHNHMICAKNVVVWPCKFGRSTAYGGVSVRQTRSFFRGSAAVFVTFFVSTRTSALLFADVAVPVMPATVCAARAARPVVRPMPSSSQRA